MDSSNLAPGWAHALIVWGIIAPLVGILVGHVLTRSWQREQWIRDCRKEEFRALLNALSEYFTTLLDLFRPMYPQGPAEQETLAVVKARFFQTVHSRIFILADVERLDVEEKWIKAVKKYRSDFDIPSFVAAFESVNRSLVKAALGRDKDVPRKPPNHSPVL